jgi:hypothetical protein
VVQEEPSHPRALTGGVPTEQVNKLAESPSDGNAPADQLPDLDSSSAVPRASARPTQSGAVTPQPPAPPWHVFLRTAKPPKIRERFVREVYEILQSEGTDGYCCLSLLEPDDSINAADLDAIFSALSSENAKHDKDILLLLLCRGGSIEPAYQISKICKVFARNRFVVAVPRQAESAATLIALGADEVHMGPLGQLGPIDPQLGGLPALGVSQALEPLQQLRRGIPEAPKCLPDIFSWRSLSNRLGTATE